MDFDLFNFEIFHMDRNVYETLKNRKNSKKKKKKRPCP